MREPDAQPTTTTKPRSESSTEKERPVAQRAQPRRTYDTLSEDNPLICRGID